MRVLLTGIKKWEECLLGINKGVHALGFVLERKCSRFVDPELARGIIQRLPPLIGTVGVFANTPRYEIQELATFCRLDWLLFLGDETPAECLDYFQPVIKYLPQGVNFQEYQGVSAFLVENNQLGEFPSSDFQPPYIIYHGPADKIPNGNYQGLYFSLDQKGRVDGIPLKDMVFLK